MDNSSRDDSATVVTESPLSNYLKRFGDGTSFTFDFWKGLSKYTSSREKVNEAPHTLAAAVELCPVHVCKKLLEAGADVNSSYPDGQTALFLAISTRCHEKVELLLKYKPSCNGQNMYEYASEYGCENITLQIIREHFGLRNENVFPFSTHRSICNIDDAVTSVQQHHEICDLVVPKLLAVLNRISKETETDSETRFVSFTPQVVGSLKDQTCALGDIDIACILKYTDGVTFKVNMLTVEKGSLWNACSNENDALLPKLVSEKFIENIYNRWKPHAALTVDSVIKEMFFHKKDKISCIRVLATSRNNSYEVFADIVPIFYINNIHLIPKASRHNNDLNNEHLRFVVSRQTEERQRIINLSNDQISALKLAKLLRNCAKCKLNEQQQNQCHVIRNFDATSILTSYMLKQSFLNRAKISAEVTLSQIISQLAGDLENGDVVSNIDQSTVFRCTHNKGVPVQDHTDAEVHEVYCLKRITALHLCNNIAKWIESNPDKTKALQAQLCQQSRLARTALFWLEQQQWKHKKSVALPTVPNSLRLIDDQLWQCRKCGISVFTLDLELVSNIPCRGMGCINDVANTGPEEVVVAAKEGLYSLKRDGNVTNRIAEGEFSSVCHHEDQLYAVHWGSRTVRVYRQSGCTWTESSRFSVTLGWSTLSVNSAGVFMCVERQHKFYHYSHSGELLPSTGSRGRGIDARYYPFLCSVDSAGTALIADRSNHSVKLLSSGGTWSVIDLQPRVEQPYSALSCNNRLYVSSQTDKSLIMYIWL